MHSGTRSLRLIPSLVESSGLYDPSSLTLRHPLVVYIESKFLKKSEDRELENTDPKAHLYAHITFSLHSLHHTKALKDLQTPRLNSICLTSDNPFRLLVYDATVDATPRSPECRHQANKPWVSD